MQAYSTDLRERVAAACAVPGSRRQEVAQRFSVSVSFIDKLVRRQRTSGSVAALPRQGGPLPAFSPQALAQLEACLGQQPDATLDELRIWLAATGGPSVGRTCVWKAVQLVGWPRKKKSPRQRT